MKKLEIGEVISDTIVTAGEWMLRALPLGLVYAMGSGLTRFGLRMEKMGFDRPGYIYVGAVITIAASIFLTTALLRGMLRKDWPNVASFRVGPDEMHYTLSSLGYSLICGLAFVIILLPVIIAVMVVLASSGFDFDRLQTSGLRSIAYTPAWFISMGVFVFGLLATLGVWARGLPYAAGVIDRRKVVAMEAFGWTKGNTMRLTAILAGLLMPLIVFMWIGARVMSLAAFGIQEATGSIHLPYKMWPQLPLDVVQSFFNLPTVVIGAALSYELYRRVKPSENAAESTEIA